MTLERRLGNRKEASLGRFANIMQNLLSILMKRPMAALLFGIMIAAVLSAGTANLGFRSDERVFFSESNEHLQRLRDFEARYGKDDTGVLVVHTPEGTLFTPEHLAALRKMTDDVWALDMVRRVDSPVAFQIAIGEGDEVIIDQLWREGDPTDSAYLKRIEGWAAQTPLLINRILSEDLATALISVTFEIPEEQSEDAPTVLTSVMRERVKQFQEDYPDLEISLSGSVALDSAFGEAAVSDSALLVPIMYTLLLGLMWLILGSWVPVFAAFLVISGAIGATLGIGGFIGIPLTSVSVISPFMITIIAVADVVHMSTAAFQKDATAQQSELGRERRHRAVEAALRKVSWPVLLTSLTTAVGFFSLIFSESPPFQHLGILAGIGTLLAMVFTFLILPTCLIVFPWRGRKRAASMQNVFKRIGYFVTARAKSSVISVLLIAVGIASFIFMNNLDDRYTRYFDNRFEFRQATDRMNSLIGGFYVVEYDLLAPEGTNAVSPAYLEDVDALAEFIRQQPGVTHVANHADRIKMVNRAFSGGQQDKYLIPSSQSQTAQLHEMYAMQLPYGLDLREQVLVDRSASRMTVSLDDRSTGEVLSLIDNAHVWAVENTPQLASSVVATGTTVMFSYIGMKNIENMILGTIVAFGAIAVFLLLVQRSLLIVSIAMLANVMPSLVALGAWGLLVGELGMAVSTIVATTLGIAVDDTIHLLTALRNRLKTMSDPREAVAEALGDAGPGMAITTFLLVVGFGILAISGFQINAWLGLMTAIVAIIALLFDLIFLPAVLFLLKTKY
ncbi:MMPL family transporter [Amylibacter sp. SFDW26]|uniref:efflux RND transporter permease subunit n=1 Tax=Amylibacter sp. SFDW26 TaxID=2652722 RepID=UPI0012616503|nr:MMPL family transporter [Amylibacter sp. SFDW26]KAB7613766.1 MMPL family transporter [Amylibacter sp. SFDW26]